MTDRTTVSDRATTPDRLADELGDTATPGRQDRRTVLRAAGFVALAGGGAAAFAACSSAATTSPSPSAAPSSEAASSSAPASPSASASESASASSSASSSAPAPTGPSAAAADIPVGSGTILPNADYVITQPTAGQYKAFTAICTHQGCKVTAVEGAKIDCNCHGSEFNITDGSVAQGPAKEPLKEFPTQVSGGKVYVQA